METERKAAVFINKKNIMLKLFCSKSSPGPGLLLLTPLFGGILLLLGNDALCLGENHLHVTGTAHEGIDSTVSPVCSSSHLGSSVHLDMIDHQTVYLESLREERRG